MLSRPENTVYDKYNYRDELEKYLHTISVERHMRETDLRKIKEKRGKKEKKINPPNLRQMPLLRKPLRRSNKYE